MTSCRLALALVVLMGIGAGFEHAAAADVRVKIENLQPNDGFYFTPVWLGFHAGGFDLFDSGMAASAELEDLAEEGMTGPLSTLFQSLTNGDGTTRYDTTIAASGGFPGAPVFDPAESFTVDLAVPDAVSNRYVSFASMVIPSNDAFFANGNPVAYEVFDGSGSLVGPVTIEIRAPDIYDAGTEVNNTLGAAFSTIGGVASDENGVVGLHPGLANFVGTGTLAGTTIGSDLAGTELLARIQVMAVPEPSAAVLLIVGLLALGTGRIRRRKC